MMVIVGLGNPGDKYRGTRHNLGREVLEHFAKTHPFSEWEEKKTAQALVSRGEVGEQDVTLVLPETFMNRSGESVREFVFPDKLETLVVVHDETALPLGKIRISYDRSAAGHNGVSSVSGAFGSDAYTRVRLGISPESSEEGEGDTKRSHIDSRQFVLAHFTPEEREVLESEVLKNASSILEAIIQEGREEAMNKYN